MVVRQPLRQPIGVLFGLKLNARQGEPFGLGFHDADCLAIGIEHVVGESALEGELPNRDAQPRRNVHLGVILNLPASRF